MENRNTKKTLKCNIHFDKSFRRISQKTQAELSNHMHPLHLICGLIKSVVTHRTQHCLSNFCYKSNNKEYANRNGSVSVSNIHSPLYSYPKNQDYSTTCHTRLNLVGFFRTFINSEFTIIFAIQSRESFKPPVIKSNLIYILFFFVPQRCWPRSDRKGWFLWYFLHPEEPWRLRSGHQIRRPKHPQRDLHDQGRLNVCLHLITTHFFVTVVLPAWLLIMVVVVVPLLIAVVV